MKKIILTGLVLCSGIFLMGPGAVIGEENEGLHSGEQGSVSETPASGIFR